MLEKYFDINKLTLIFEKTKLRSISSGYRNIDPFNSPKYKNIKIHQVSQIR